MFGTEFLDTTPKDDPWKKKLSWTLLKLKTSALWKTVKRVKVQGKCLCKTLSNKGLVFQICKELLKLYKKTKNPILKWAKGGLFPDGPVVKTLHFQCRRTWVPFLISELGSHMLSGQKKNKGSKGSEQILHKEVIQMANKHLKRC